jgi:predicted ATPase
MAFPRSGTQFSDRQEYIFKNSYLSEVAYGMIPLRSRTTFHKAAACWLAQFEGTIHKVMAAEHFEKAGEYILAAEQYEMALATANTRRTLGETENLTLRSQAARAAGDKEKQNE